MDGDDGETPWSEVQYRNKKRNHPDGIEMTFLVQNLPNRVSKTLLWRAFQPYGFITDAHVARKKDSRGNHFGFVRYVVAEKVDVVLLDLNTVRIFDTKLKVSLAKYDKNHKKFIYTSGMVGERKEWRAKEPDPIKTNSAHNSKYDNNVGPSYSTFVRDGQSFRDLFRDKNANVVQGAKSIEVEGNGSVYALHCIGRSIVGTVKDVKSLNCVKQSLEARGINEFGLSYIGGLSVLITLHSRQVAIDTIGAFESVLASVFSKFYIWNGEDFPVERIVSIRISGIPFILRDNTIYERIGLLFGKVVKPSEFSWQSVDNSDGEIIIATSQGSRIEESIVLNWKNRKFVVWVSELPGCWSPDFDDGESEGESDRSSDEEVSQKGDEQMEEGEYIPVPEKVDPQLEPGNGESPKIIFSSPVAGRLRNRKSRRILIPICMRCMGMLIRRLIFLSLIMSLWVPI
ncbi:putative RNA recognition motif domain, nucleotide-binding alpha-beta plait domain superfamily [Helianthus debilis subsp. tardiflorus]